MRELRTKMEQAVQDTIGAARIVDGFKSPQQHGAYLKNYATFPMECVVFSSLCCSFFPLYPMFRCAGVNVIASLGSSAY